MADNTPFSVTELQGTPEYAAANPVQRAAALNANQEQWRQHLRDDFGPVEDGAYWQSLNDVEAAHEKARGAEIGQSIGAAIKEGKISQDQAKGYLTKGPDAFMQEDPEAATFLQTLAPREALTGPYVKRVVPLAGANGKAVGTMWVRGNSDGAEVAYRFDDNEEVVTKGDGTGMITRLRKDGTPARDSYGVWVSKDPQDKIILDQKERIKAAELNREINSGGGAPFTEGLMKENEDAVNGANAKLTEYSDPVTGVVRNAMDRFVDHAKKNLSDKLPEGGILASLGGEMAKGWLSTGAIVSNPGFLFGSREDGEDARQDLAMVDEITGRRRGGFEGGFVNDVTNSILQELPNLALTMGTGLAAGAARGAATFAAEEAMLSQASGVAAKGLLARGLSVLPKNTVANLLDGGLGKAVGTNAIEGAMQKEVADRVSASIFSMPSTLRSGYENWVQTVDKADSLRAEGKTKEADEIEANATMNAWAGIAIENVSENIWLNEMLVTRGGHKLSNVATDILKTRLGAEGLDKIKGRFTEAIGATLKAAPQGAVEEAAAGIAGRAWMNQFAAQNQDLTEGLGVEMTVGALMEGMAGAAKSFAENGRPEIMNELMSRAVQGDSKAEGIYAEAMKNSKAGAEIPVDPVVVAGDTPAEDKQPVNTTDDFITFTNDSGGEEVLANNNKILEGEDGFSLADANFADRKFETRRQAEEFAETRYETAFRDRMVKSITDRGVELDEAEATVGLVDKMFDTAARGAGVRKDMIYKRVELEEAGDFNPAPAGDVLTQPTPSRQKLRGSYQNIEDGARGLIKVFSKADPSTYLHESFHALQQLNISGKNLIDHALGGESASFWDWATDGGAVARDSVDALERGARGLEAYLREGVAPTPELESVFQKVAKLLKSVYQSVKELGVNLTPAARKAFDSLFASEGDGLPVIPGQSRPLPGPNETPGQIARASSEERMNAAKRRLGQAPASTEVLGQSSPVPKEKAPDLLEIAGYYLTNRRILSLDDFLREAAADDVLGRLDPVQLGWLYERASIVTGVSEATEDAAYLGDLSAEMQRVLSEFGQIDAEYVKALTSEASRIVLAEGARSGYKTQAAAMAETLDKSKTAKSAMAAIERAEGLIERMAYGRFSNAAKSLRLSLNAYTKGQKTGANQVKSILREVETLFAESLGENSGIDEDIKSAVRDVIRKTRMVAEGGKMSQEELVPQIAAAMARVAAASGKAAKKSAQRAINAARAARRETIAGKKDLIAKVKEAIRASKVKLTNTEVRSVLNVISTSNTPNEVIQRGSRLAKILGKAYLRNEYNKARALHAGVQTRLKRGIYGDASDTVIRPLVAITPTDIPVELLPAYIAHLEALNDGIKAVAFGDYKESLLSLTAAAQQFLINEAASEPDITEADAAARAGTAATIRSDAEDALDGFLRVLDPNSVRPEARLEARQIKWLVSNPAIMDDWSTSDIVALMKSLKNAQNGVIDVLFGKAAGRAAVAQIEPSFRTIFDIATRKELGIRSTPAFENLSPQQEANIRLDAARTYARSIAGLFSDRARPNLLAAKGGYAGKLDSAGQHFMGDFLGVGDMIDTWLHAPMYKAAIHANKQASGMLEPFTRSYQKLEEPGSLTANLERLADRKGGAMDIPGTRQFVRRQQVAGKMVMAYLLQREHEDNGAQGSWILEELKRMDGEGRENRPALTEPPAETESKRRVINLIGAATKADFSAAGIFGILSDRQKQIIKDYDAMKQGTGSKVFYRSLLTRGQLLPMFKNHVHHKSVEARGDLDSTQSSWGSAIAPAALANAGDKNKDSPARPPSSYDRMPGVRNVSWELYDVVTQEITDVMLDYEITPILSAAGKAMRNIEFTSPSETTKEITRAVMQAEAGHAAVMAMHANSEGRIASSFGSFIKNWITNKAITSPIRLADEFVSSAVRWIIQDPGKLKAGITVYSQTPETKMKWKDLFFKMGLTVAVRGDQFSLEGVESRINNINGGEIERALTNPFKWGRESFGVGGGEKPTNPGMLGWITSNKWAQKNAEWGRALNSFGDTALAMPMAVGNFLKEYKSITGQDFNIDAVDQMVPEAMRVAGIATDRFIDQNIAPSHSAKNALKVQGGVDGKGAQGALRFLLYGLGTYSRTIMHQSIAQLGVILSRGAGIKERAAAFRTLSAMTISATAYNVLAQAVVRSIWALGGGDEEEKDLAEFFNELDEPEYWFRQTGAGFFGNLIGGRGLFARIALGSGIEGAWKTARTAMWGDYDKYSDNMLNAIPAQALISGEDVKFEDGYRMTTGLFGVAANTAVNMVKDVNYITEDATPQGGKVMAGINVASNMLHVMLQFPAMRDLEKLNAAKRAHAERAANFKERFGKDFAKEKSQRESAAKRYVATGDPDHWQEYYGKLTDDQKKSADNTLKKETALGSARVLDGDEWRRLASITDPETKAAEYQRLYNKAKDKTAFMVERNMLDKAGSNVWSKDPGSEFRKALRALGLP